MGKMTIQDSADILNDWLKPFKEKEAAEATSMTKKIKDVKQLGQFQTKGTQTNLGIEQSEEAKAGGSNVENVAPNSDADKKRPYDNTLDTDEKLTTNSDVLGNVQKQEISMTQKIARAEKLASGILNTFESAFSKEASARRNMTPVDHHLEKLASKASFEGEKYAEAFFAGQVQRLKDETELRTADSDGSLAQFPGGYGALLDKTAMEDPGAVVPEEILAADQADTGMEYPEGTPADIQEDAQAGEEGTPSEQDLQELAQALDEAGIQPEDLDQATQQVNELKAAGASEPEILQAITELDNGQGPEEMPEITEKTASLYSQDGIQRARINAIKQVMVS